MTYWFVAIQLNIPLNDAEMGLFYEIVAQGLLIARNYEQNATTECPFQSKLHEEQDTFLLQ